MYLWYLLQINIAFVIDLLIGDPPKIPHPVIIMGKAIEKIESILRRYTSTSIHERLAGMILVFIILASSYYLTELLLYLLGMIHPWLSWMIGTWLISTTIAIKGLAKEGKKINRLLQRGDLVQARKHVGYIVGRDTDYLDEREVIRATVETVAENIVDAIISPLFYALIGGPALAMTYRASNTLDSMCGYKNDRYLHFGWASARIDDLLNFIPARLTGILLIIAAWILRLNAKQAYKIWKRDAHLHPSPNSGIPESVVAGALGVRLGGINFYFGQPNRKAYLGDNLIPMQQIHIRQTIFLLYMTAWLFIILFQIVFFLLIY